MPKRKVNFTLTQEVHHYLKAVAYLKGLSISSLIEHMTQKEIDLYQCDIDELVQKMNNN